MNKNLLALAAFLCSISSLSQISYGGEPANWTDKRCSSDIPFVMTEQPDYDRLAQEDAITDQHKDVPYRFGVEYEVSYNFENSGTWVIDTDNGTMTWRLGIECPGANAISIRFDRFHLPENAQLFIWSADRKEFIGAFTSENNRKTGRLAMSLVHGDKIVIEYVLPLDIESMGELQIGQIVHVYRSFLNSKLLEETESEQRGPFGNSGDCNVNVNCPEGADWEVEKRSVAIIVEGGYGYCTGALVNNTANDGTPYFLTANHCTQGADVGDWVFYFNHESANCNGSTGPTNQSISGSSLVANNNNSDFALLLLDDTPPVSFNVQYAGWNATDDEDQVESAVGIHHPSGDVKKICFEDDGPYHDTGNGAEVWWIDNWELGITEPGSSGSPLFDQDHRIIGQLYGGASACNGSAGNGLYDFYGRFGESWDAGNSSASRLREWLDPGNTGILILDGYPEGFVVANIDPGVGSIGNVEESICSSVVSPEFTLTNHGITTLNSCTINYQLNSGTIETIDWTGTLSQNNSTVIVLPDLTAQNGNNTLTIWVTNPSGGSDENDNNNEVSVSFSAVTGESYSVTLDFTFDDYPEETSWEIVTDNNDVLFSGGPYPSQSDGSNLQIDFCLASGCYELIIYDDYEDGMCCNYGDGSYELSDQDGSSLASGAEFEESETSPFCLGESTVTEFEEYNPVVFPNPASSEIRISSKFSVSELKIYDASGKLLIISNPNAMNTLLNTSQFPDGIYQIVTTSGVQQGSARILIRH